MYVPLLCRSHAIIYIGYVTAFLSLTGRKREELHIFDDKVDLFF